MSIKKDLYKVVFLSALVGFLIAVGLMFMLNALWNFWRLI